MTPERWNLLSELFEAALQRSFQDRKAFLAEACGDDDELRGEVESLLAEHGRAGDFMDAPVNAEAASALRQVSQDEAGPDQQDPYLGMTLGNRYHIEARLARGGQALVYRALDLVVMSKPVVIKILHAAAGQNVWLQKRFLHEMEALSLIDHPGIVGVLDSGQLPNGAPYLVVQYVDGVTLRQELQNGALDPARCAAILRQIGAALDAAHALGVAHRDLKPENIMLQRLSDGTELVKLIDFGIAKVERSALSSNTTTVVVAGTVRYMAPEQFQGENSSASDIYALGLIASEMLSGQPDIHALRAPRMARELICTALAYRPQDRPERASAFCNQLAGTLSVASEEETPRDVARPRVRRAWLIGMLSLATLAAVALLSFRERPTRTGAVKLSLAPPDGTTFSAFAVSPDGRTIAVVAADSAGKARLWVRALASHVFQPLAGTEGASFPFWSADSRFVAFFADGKLKKIDASGGPPQTICNAETGSRGGAWSSEGVILFTPNPATPLYRVSASGGDPTPVTTLDTSRGESTHSWPQFLPDGRRFLFLVESADPAVSGIYTASLDSTVRSRVLTAGTSAVYASGYLLFLRERTLMAQPFDAARLQLKGESLPVAENVAVTDSSRQARFSASEGGVLAYDSRDADGYTELQWFDRVGNKVGTVTSGSGGRTIYSNVNLSRDGSRIAVDRRDPQTAARDIWLFDLARGGESRLTFDPATDASPVWAPDGSRLAFFSARDGVWNLYQKAATGAGNDEPLLRSNESKITCDWALDRRHIVFREWDSKTKWDLWALPLDGDRIPVLIVRTPLEETCGQLSPDGRWLAYVSGEPGREEVYLQPFNSGAEATGRWQISTNGGMVPRWRRDGKEIFYLSLDHKLMAVPVTSGATFHAGVPRPLFQTRAAGFLRYDVTSDGQRFLVITATEDTPSLPTVVLNWTGELR